MNLPVLREWSQPRPLLGLAVVTMTGILIADHFPPYWHWHYWPVLLPGLVVTLFGLLRIRHWSSLLPLFLMLAIVNHGRRLDVTRDHPWRIWLEHQDGPTWVEAEGFVEQPFRRNLPGFEPGEAFFRAIEVIDLGGDGAIPATHSAHFLLRLPTNDNLTPGRYRFTGWVKLPPPADNPGQFNKRQYDLRLGIIGQIQVAHFLKEQPASGNLASQLIQTSENCREWISATLTRHLPENSPAGVVLTAMTLGASDTATPEIQLPFRLSGTLHIFAVSGLHVAIIGMIFWFILRCIGISRGSQPIVLIPILCVYTFITGLPPSAVRSTFMACILLLGMIGNRRADLLNSLGAAALVLLILDTNQLFQAGFQLSFGVLAAIALLANLLRAHFKTWEEPDPFLPKNLLGLGQRFLWSVRKFCVATLCVSIAAWIGSLPLMLYHFHTITPIGLLANLILVPWSTIVLSLAVTRLAIASLAPPSLQTGFAWLSQHAANFTLWTAQLFADVPYGHIYLPSPSIFPRPEIQLTVLRSAGADGVNHLRVGNEHWLLDCGSLRQFPFVLQPYLHHQGINQIDHLLLSHADTDHQGAAPMLQSHYRLQQVHAPFPPNGQKASSWTSWNIVHSPDLLSIPSTSPEKARLEILFPPQGWQANRADDRSIIARIIINHHRILWCNDAGFLAEKHLLETLAPEDLHCDVLIRNQHNSDHSMLPEFLLAASPVVLISSHADFPDGQQIPDSLRQQCLRLGILLYDQSQCGAVTLHFWPDKLQVSPFRGKMPVFTLASNSPPPPRPVQSLLPKPSLPAPSPAADPPSIPPLPRPSPQG